MLHPDLQELLNYAIQDREISLKEREILHKKAIELGQDIDFLEMVIEGEIQKMIKNKEEDNQKNQTCPNCGNSIPNSSIKCIFCGFEISKKTITGQNSIKILSDILSQIDIVEAEIENRSNSWTKPYNPFGGLPKKAMAISIFSMPNDKESMIEFFIFCDSNADAHSNTKMLGNHLYHVNKFLFPVWTAKARLGYTKLKRFENEDSEIRSLVEKYKKKYGQENEGIKKDISPLKKMIAVCAAFGVFILILNIPDNFDKNNINQENQRLKQEITNIQTLIDTGRLDTAEAACSQIHWLYKCRASSRTDEEVKRYDQIRESLVAQIRALKQKNY